VEKDNLRRRIAPYDCAHLSIADINVSTRHLWFAMPYQPGIFSAVDQKRKLAIFRVHSADTLVGKGVGLPALAKPTGYTLLGVASSCSPLTKEQR
jgi:hypothetical protein